MRQGSLNVATWVIVNGRLGSGFCSPALICARAVADTRVSSSAAFRSVFMYVSPRLTNVRDPTSVYWLTNFTHDTSVVAGRPQE